MQNFGICVFLFFGLVHLFFTFAAEARGDISRSLLYRAKRQDGDVDQEWCFWNDCGPKNWVSMGYDLCGGQQQSPVALNIKSAEEKGIGKINFHDHEQKVQMQLNNTGRVVKLTVAGQEYLHITDGGLEGRFEFLSADIHFTNDSSATALHKLSALGAPTSLEIHLAYTDINDKMVIIAILCTQGKNDNEDFRPIDKQLGNIKYKDDSVILNFALASLLPEDQSHFFRYIGSHTYPPCDEDVIWTVYNATVTLGKRQMKLFRDLYRTKPDDDNPQPLSGNVRPLQDLNGRDVYYAK